MRRVASVLCMLACWFALAAYANSTLLPSPWAVAKEMGRLITEQGAYRHLLISFFRGVTGLALALIFGILAGVFCGLKKTRMEIISPLVSALQGCPTIVWVSLLMVWVGIGSVVPIVAIAVATFPVIFLNVAHGVSALDKRLLVMSRLYHAGPMRTLRDIVFPGISSYLLAGFAFSASICWKVASTAEFIGSESGVGSQIYWAYHDLNIPRLFCWALILIVFALALDAWLIKPLQQVVSNQKRSINGQAN
jgi:NitT/TauT family transport system permease protein